MRKIKDYIIIAWLICSFIAMCFGKVDKAIFAMAWAIFLRLEDTKSSK